MGLKSRVLDTLGLQTVHTEIDLKDSYIFKGSPFNVEVIVTAGKKGAVVERVTSKVYFETIAHDESTALLILSLVGVAGEIIIGTGGGDFNHLGDKVVRITVHEASLKKVFRLSPGKSKRLKVTPTVPDEYPIGQQSSVYIIVEAKISNGPDIRNEKRIDLFPNVFKSAPLIVLTQKFGFRHKILRDQTMQPVTGERFLLVAQERPYRRVNEINLTVTDLEDGKLEYVLAFEMFEKPDGILKGKHETVMVHFELHRDQLMKIDGTIDMSLIEGKVQKAFDEAEGKFGKVYSVKM